MHFDPQEFFDSCRDHLETGEAGISLMERWIELATSWRGQSLALIRKEALMRLVSVSRGDRLLALQALAVVGEPDDLPRLTSDGEDAEVTETCSFARDRLRLELTSDEDLAAMVVDVETFGRFVNVIGRRRGRIDALIEAGFNPREARHRDRWNVHSIALFLDNAMCQDELSDRTSGPTWSDLARAILRGKEYQ